MTARVSPTEAIRAEIDELISGAERGSLLEHFEEVARAAVRLVFQSALEAEVTEFFGRARYARGEREREGSRNGYSPMSIKTTAGEVTLQRPKTRGSDVAFASRLLGSGVTRTNALESPVIAGFVRGLSVRNVEATLLDALGADSTISKSTVSRVCEAIKEEFDTWKTRDLSGVRSTTCSLTAATSACTRGRRPSPCLPISAGLYLAPVETSPPPGGFSATAPGDTPRRPLPNGLAFPACGRR